MGELLRKPTATTLADGVTLVQDVNQGNAPLEYVGFKVLDLAPNATHTESTGILECCVVALTGKVNVTVDGDVFANLGTRERVFDRRPTDSVYASQGKTIAIQAVTKATVALCYAPSHEVKPTRVIRAADNGIEHRGILNNQRTVHNILPDNDPTADSLLVVEVFTETANWSSYPPHKHDRDLLPEESLLEETYYHEIDPAQGFVFQRVYTDDRTLDETMAVEHRNVVVVPRGYHPVGVPDGYSSYYLNVMAGPKRIWKFWNDPDHSWILHRQPK